MKKLISFLLILVCLTGSACADRSSRWINLSMNYNACAGIYGAPLLEGDKAVFQNDDMHETFIFRYDTQALIFQFTGDNLTTAMVCSDTLDMDFLMSCLSTICALGSIDFQAYGILLNDYAQMRAKDTESIPSTLGIDVFQLKKVSDNFEYAFVYMNNDMKYGE